MTTLDWLEMGADHNDDRFEELNRQLQRNSFFTQATLREHGRTEKRLEAYVSAILDLLLSKGVVTIDDLGDTVKAKQAEQIEEDNAPKTPKEMLDGWPNIILREDKDGLPDAPDEPVNCAERMHICKAVCCSLRFPLSSEEIEAGKVRWDLGHPYVIRHTAEGWCVHNDRNTGGCGVYEDRPKLCRRYSCRDDERIWKDFDNMVLNEDFLAQKARGDRFEFEGVRPAPVTFIPRTAGNTP